MDNAIKFFINDTKKTSPIVTYLKFKKLFATNGLKGEEAIVDINASIEFPYYMKKSHEAREAEILYHEISYSNIYSKEKYGYDNVQFSLNDDNTAVIVNA